ncbi:MULTISPECIES: LacI family DNA-binding transcriptional regulator [unclassified Gilliamella]|uniref:LacI family DNA-binding transcriptional regulator n=1 Tax=unclassified Gilliamella TaxID=2685620 RepID=UPI00132B364A|nr:MULTISPECIES: LacI family DNA-binding transcriptional regulator [unclassified Gilliamella]MWN31860.1 LacI family DNA-binding transcriptional regulator [Gilliamella sp. Pra-s60]MWP29218.1 LacI family DNA-binding transcriptional regulator [Gilliamella sp. Pra-s54]
MVSIKDVAKLASVSLMTVSRAINDPSKLNKETYKRVKQAIDELNYVPHLSARKIRGNNSGPSAIGVLVLETAMTPFCVELLQAIEKTAQNHGWNTFIVNLFDDKNTDHAINTLLSYRPNGIIYTTMELKKVKIPDKLLNKNVVLANCISESKKLASYIPDNYLGQYQAMQQVIKKGYQKPLCIYLSENTLTTQTRRQAIEQAWIDAGKNLTDITNHHITTRPQNLTQEYMMTIEILKQHCNKKPNFDVLICGNDQIAFVAYQFLLSKGLKIPNDIAVLGYDNIVGTGELFYPPLTTVQQPYYKIGEQAALHIIDGKSQKEVIPVTSPYLERASL